MRNAAALRVLLMFALIVPLAIYVGYLLSNPYNLKDLGIVVAVIVALLFPILIRDHHVLPFMFWNASLNMYFLPARPAFWILASLLSTAFAFFGGALSRRNLLFKEPSISAPLVFLFLVILATAQATGGFGGESTGSDRFGGKIYVAMFGAIIGYFALVSHEIPVSRIGFYVAIFFLSSLTAALSDVILLLGPSFYFLFAFVSPDIAVYQAESSLENTQIVRMAGVWLASQGVCYYLLARHGIKGILDPSRWWRSLLFVAFAGLSLLGGFRSTFLTLALLVAIQFFAEKLLWTVLFPMTLASLLVGSICVLPFVDKLPLSVQRALSFLPVTINPEARKDAEGTAEWRWEMWKAVYPEVPKYLWKGKGFSYNATDMYLVEQANRRGFATGFDTSIVANAYHSGPLTTIIPFGIWGAIGFLWFSWSSLRYLYRKKERGHPALANINTFLFSLFLCRLVYFLTVYGQFNSDLFEFTGLIGFSIALNRGAENRELSPEKAQLARGGEKADKTTRPAGFQPRPA